MQRTTRDLWQTAYAVTDGAKLRAISATTLSLIACSVSNVAHANEFELYVEYTGDVFGPIDGADRRGVYLDNLDVTASLDVSALAGWSADTMLFAHVLNNSGGAPNEAAQTLQGVDNIEVARQGLRLYEFWVETNIGPLNARAGLYDVNSEFYSNEAAGLLVAPAFGIGSELAASGPNGPSIFPSTALALRLGARFSPRVSGRFAVVNAQAGVPGDPGGVDTALDNGALLIGELSWDGDTHIDVGAWTYTEEQDDLRLVAVRQRAAGAYVTVEREVQPGATLFGRLGVSDGDTTPYAGGWQAGMLFDAVLPSRPASQVSFGVYQGQLASKFRANQLDAGVRASAAETGVEFTYSDELTPWLRLQPDLQLVLDPNGDRDREDLWVAGLRFVITPFGH